MSSEQKTTRRGPSIADGRRIAAWRFALLYDLHSLMPNDQLIAESLLEALAIRMSFRYDPPVLRKRRESDRAEVKANVPGVGHC